MKRWVPLASVTLFAAAVFVVVSSGPSCAADVIKFGISTPLSGPAAPWGIPHKQATELVFDEINSKAEHEVGGMKSRLDAGVSTERYEISRCVDTVNQHTFQA